MDKHEIHALLRYEPVDGSLWRRKSGGQCGKAPNTEGYRRVSINGKRLLQHRVIWFMAYGEWPNEIDHIDRDKTNNRLCNLRSVTRSQNAHNRGSHRNNTSGYKGVTWDKQMNKWRGQVTIDGQKHQKLFNCPEEASEWYQATVSENHN